MKPKDGLFVFNSTPRFVLNIQIDDRYIFLYRSHGVWSSNKDVPLEPMVFEFEDEDG